MKLSPLLIAGTVLGSKKARTNDAIDQLENTIRALGNDQNALFNDARFQKNLNKRFKFLRRYYQNGAECATGEVPDFYVESNLQSIGSAFRGFHEAVFVGEGKKCERKRGNSRVQNQMRKVRVTKICYVAYTVYLTASN